MNILLICNKIPYPPKDGGSLATLNMAEGLVENGNRVTILTMITFKHYFNPEKIPLEIKNKIDFIGVRVDTSLSVFKALQNFLFSSKPYNAVRFITDKFSEKLIELLSNTKFDIIQLEGLYLCPYIETIRKYSKSPVFYRAHNVEYRIWQRIVKNTKNPVKKFYLKNLSKRIEQFEKSFINQYDAIIPITQNDAEIYNQAGNKKPCFVSPASMVVNNYTIENQTIDNYSMFYIGSLDWFPNIEGLEWFLNTCWNSLTLKYPDLKFYIAGRNASEKLVSLIEKKQATYCGEVPDAQEFAANKAIMLVPLFSGSGMRVKIIEGMAMQKAIVTTTIGVEGIPVTNEKDCLIADTPEKYIRSISQLIEDKNYTKIIAQNARNFVYNNFDINVIAKKLTEFYKSYKQ